MNVRFFSPDIKKGEKNLNLPKEEEPQIMIIRRGREAKRV
jgi:hypothetical protein